MTTDLLRDLWTGAEQALRRRLGSDRFERWLGGLVALGVTEGSALGVTEGSALGVTEGSALRFEEGDAERGACGVTLSLGVSNAWVQEWIETRYLDDISDVLGTLAGRRVDVRLTIDSELFGLHRARQRSILGGAANGATGARAEGDGAICADRGAQPSAKIGGPSDRTGRSPRLDDLVEAPCNQLAIRAARSIAVDPGRLYNPLFIHGSSGVGKSHLVRAIYTELTASARAREGGMVGHLRRGRCLSADRFSQHFAASAQDGTLRKFRETYRGLDVLVVDDVQVLATRTKSQDELLHTLEALVDAGRQVVIVSDRPPRGLDDLSAGLVNRFLGGLVTRIDRPDFATRWKIARRHASRIAASREQDVPWGASSSCGARRWRGALAEDVLEFVAQRLEGGVHDLVGAVLRLDVHGRVLGRSPTVEEAGQALAELLCERDRRVDVDRIRSQVVAHFGWTEKDLVSRSRQRALTFARQVAMYLCARYTRHSMREIGKRFGDRDPATVRFACKKIADLLPSGSPDHPLSRDVFAIIDQLEG